jgi:hypothetical protein
MVSASSSLLGLTCFTDLPFTPHNISATLDAENDTDIGISAGLGDFAYVDCPTGTVAGVRTLTAANHSSSGDFYVTFN